MRNLDDTPLYQQKGYSPIKNSYTLLYVSILVLSMAAFLIGYGKFIFSGALTSIEQKLNLSTEQVEVLISSLFFSGLVGSALAWPIGRYLGRKVGTIISAVFMLIGSVIIALVADYYGMIIGRSFLGFGIGITGVVTLIYISEIVPANIRGSSVCLMNLTFHLGLVLSFLLGWGLSDVMEWRWLMASTIIPALAFLVLMFFIPETPQWYVSQGKIEKAKKVLFRLRRVHDTQLELDTIEDNFEFHEGMGGKFWSKGVFKALFIGVSLGVFLEATGLDSILYYGPTILKAVGYTTPRAAITVGVWIAITSLVFSFIVILLIDFWGRRKLLLTGISIMVLSLLALGFLVQSAQNIAQIKGWFFFFLMLFAAGFTVGLGGVGFLLISELYPFKIRSFAVSVALTVKWLANYFIGRYYLSAVSIYGEHTVFWVFGFIGFIAFLFCFYLVPETAGKTLEEIEDFWIEEKEHGTVIET